MHTDTQECMIDKMGPLFTNKYAQNNVILLFCICNNTSGKENALYMKMDGL